MPPDDLDWLDRLTVAIAAAEAGPTAHDLAAAPVIDLWRPLVSPTGVVVLCGFVAGHPRLGNALTRTSPLVGLDTGAGHARTVSRWYRLGLGLPAADARTEHDPWSMYPPTPGFMPFEDLDTLSRLLAVTRARIMKFHAAAEARSDRRRH